MRGQTAAIWDENEFAALEASSDALMTAIKTSPKMGKNRLEAVRQTLREIVLGSVRVKAFVVSSDEREGGLRNLLNFGHSIGHAYEGILTPQILHGECVSIGMALEAALSHHLGHLSSSAVARLSRCLVTFGLPISPEDPILKQRSGHKVCYVDRVLSIMGVDKKNDGGKKRIVLLSAIGRTLERKASIVDDKDIRLILSSAILVHPLPNHLGHVICTPPGSKSISNRALVLAALGNGPCRIKNLLHSDDTEVMLQALQEMRAADFQWEDNGSVLVVTGRGGCLRTSHRNLYLGNAGTASRFLTAVVTLASPGDTEHLILTGNGRMKTRPIGPLVDALRLDGADISYVEKTGSLPLSIKANGGLVGGRIELAATISSQYVSAILMCAPYAQTQVTLCLVGGKPVSQPYIDMTLAMMASFGIKVKRSSTENHTYYIPQGQYSNPKEFSIESDASSATYPLALAAITGDTCTVPNIGSRSLQGDAKFAREVLEPMGCQVEQGDYSTTVKGPSRGALKPLLDIDMETMTDAFLTASVLAAVANGSARNLSSTIRGIANQRVKECDRIHAMRIELQKFGVECEEFQDGIKINAIAPASLIAPKDGVHCYDDHRVAMSFSVLASIVPQATLIKERECVNKTWPGWWRELSKTFHVQTQGVDSQLLEKPVINSPMLASSIFFIGMRGSGKSTTGKRAANILKWPFVDLDELLEKEYHESIPEIIASKGWDRFREIELSMLERSIQNHPSGHIFACGGGIVEKQEARLLLQNHQKSGGAVILIKRNLHSNSKYLHADKTRPAYTESIEDVWKRREPWYLECSNYEYQIQELESEGGVHRDALLQRLLQMVTRSYSPLEDIMKKKLSFFVSLTAPNVSHISGNLPRIALGSDAMELRIDLLEDAEQQSMVPTPSFVAAQISHLRELSSLPIIFTIRTSTQGGKFPEGAEVEKLALSVLALRMGIEFLDLEVQSSESFLHKIAHNKGTSKIIASHHDPEGKLAWNNGSWVPYYNKALQYGDVIKLVGRATTEDSNKDLQEFRLWAQSAHSIPLIAINMGTVGQLSRIQNTFFTPVSHPLLPQKAAPGQLSAAEIRHALTLHGIVTPKSFSLIGSPISMSRSPYLHNSLFMATGYPYRYELFETSTIEALPTLLGKPGFGGASVTIPLKLDVIPLLDEISEDARLIGAVNTIVPLPHRNRPGESRQFLTGHNTDWQGISLVLENAQAPVGQGLSALVIGTGGTSRAAIHALHRLNCSPIFILGRYPPKQHKLVQDFPQSYNLRVLTAMEDLGHTLPGVAISAIPGNSMIDDRMLQVVTQIFHNRTQELQYQGQPVFVEMAYQPSWTKLRRLADELSWTTVAGADVLAAQGIFQVILFTAVSLCYKTKASLVLSLDRHHTTTLLGTCKCFKSPLPTAVLSNT